MALPWSVWDLLLPSTVFVLFIVDRGHAGGEHHLGHQRLQCCLQCGLDPATGWREFAAEKGGLLTLRISDESTYDMGRLGTSFLYMSMSCIKTSFSYK